MALESLIQLSLVTLFLPLAGFLLLIFFGKRMPRQGDWLGTGLVTVAFAISLVILFVQLAAPGPVSAGFTWATFGGIPGIGEVNIELGILIDNLSAVMLVVVMLISMLVHFFSIGYLEGDVRYSRYFAYLGLFTFSMLGIVITHNLLMMYIFWELVGLSSYLLIGHWYEKKSASNAAMKAFIVNRIGDAGMFIGIMIIFVHFSTFSFDAIFGALSAGNLPFESQAWLTAAGILIFCGAIGKSAQFPLHVWLPDAMEGPTPVSALIHAATMVAAGVFMVARLFPLFTADALLVIAYIGAITALLAATIAITQFDIKKVLAWSTISQLGYMVMALGVGAYAAGFMHLVTHAAFKAGLFLGSGAVIYAMHAALHKKHDHDTDAQDIRNMGGLKSRMPVTYWTFLIFTLAISGIPLTSGFLSKDEILAGTLAFSTLSGHWLLPLIAFTVAGMTAFYMFRLFILTFHGEHAQPERLPLINEVPGVMSIPLMVLATLSIFVFYSFNPFGASSGWLFQALERPLSAVPEAVAPATWPVLYEAISRVHTLVMILSIVIAVAGLAFAWLVYQKRAISAEMMAAKMGRLYHGSRNKWYFDEMYEAVFVNGTLALTRISNWFDARIIDGIVNGAGTVTQGVSRISGWIDNTFIDGLVNFLANFTGAIGMRLRRIQTGNIQTYLVFALVGFLVITIVLLTF
ncbi:MAG: NADH-quinone oxidoreductase subunit L [Balneolaceae bacterium]|nr:MAG: NADH-quinone oxidoreductase subunit L [Balneolaceae bacterium]